MTTLTKKGQVTIPKDIREDLGLRPGDDVDFKQDNGQVLLQKKLKILPFDKWRGYLGKFRTDKLMEEIR